MQPVNQLMIIIALTTPSPSPQPPTSLCVCGGGGGCVQFLYRPHTLFNHPQGNVSGSMNSDPVNVKYTGQLSTKELFCDKIEGCFISSKTTD